MDLEINNLRRPKERLNWRISAHELHDGYSAVLQLRAPRPGPPRDLKPLLILALEEIILELKGEEDGCRT